MDFSVSGMYKRIGAYFGRMSAGKRLGLAVAAILSIVAAVALTQYLDKASYAVLYRGLASSEGVEVVNMLVSAGVDYRLEGDGTILVPRKDEARLRMQLAASGFPNSTLGYDVFASQSDLMTTDYEKRQYLVFQLQDRLQDALRTLTGVRNAIVTLNVAREDAYVLKSDKPESTASVVLDLYAYAALDAKQIRGIGELVAKSVPGLKSDNVIIIDSEGAILGDRSSGEGLGLTDSQIELINQINGIYEQKIRRFLEPVFGSDGISISVSVAMNFQQKSSEQTLYSPVVDEGGIIAKQQLDRQGAGGGAAGGAAGTESNVGVPTYQDEDGSASTGNFSESSSTEYLVNRSVENLLDNGGHIQDMTVSMLINANSLTPESIQQYREMVAFSVGISPEKVFISSAEFLPKPTALPMPPPAAPSDDIFPLPTDVLIYAGAGAAALLLLALVLGMRRRRPAPVSPGGGAAQGAAEAAAQEKKPLPEEIVLSETREQGLKRQVKEFASTNPEIVAQLLRTWMKEDPK